MANKWLIDANELLAEIAKVQALHPDKAVAKIIMMITGMESVDAVEVVHGRWVSDEGDVLFHCSECETQISTSWDYDDLHWNYCPNCGAKMDGGEDNATD